MYEAGSGELVLKPRDRWHTFWKAGDEQARALEIISPANFEQFFQDIAPFFPPGQAPDLNGLLATSERYGLEVGLESMPELMGRFGLVAPPEMIPPAER